MALSSEEVRKVALLARLELTDSEIDEQAKHINNLLQQFEIIEKVDVTGIEPTSHSIPMFNVLREDVSRPSLPREQVLANAPEAREGCFVVPVILEA